MPIAIHSQRLAARFIIAILAHLFTGADAQAQSCSFSIGNLNFGTISLAAGGAIDSTSTFNANCTGTPGATVRVCVSLGAGSGSAGAGGSPRFMTNGTNTLAYNMFTDAARTNVWGSSSGLLGLFGAVSLSVSLNAQGSGTANRTIYGRINSGQQVTPPGLYQSVFSGADSSITYQYLSLLNCISILSPTVNAPFTVQANLLPSCTVSATPLDFGTAGNLNQVLDGISAITATCPNTVPFTIGLNGGNAAASDPTQRKMSKGSDQITYGLYQNASRTVPWGDLAGSNINSLIGSGSSQSITVYGRIPIQSARPAGTYTDTVVVTLTY